VNEVSDLSIILSSDLNFKRHTKLICAKLSRNVDFIKRNTLDMNYTCVNTLYFFMVRLTLEFGSLIWNLHRIGFEYDKIVTVHPISGIDLRRVFFLHWIPRCLSRPSSLFSRALFFKLITYSFQTNHIDFLWFNFFSRENPMPPTLQLYINIAIA
jgi:hypothetical protein